LKHLRARIAPLGNGRTFMLRRMKYVIFANIPRKERGVQYNPYPKHQGSSTKWMPHTVYFSFRGRQITRQPRAKIKIRGTVLIDSSPIPSIYSLDIHRKSSSQTKRYECQFSRHIRQQNNSIDTPVVRA
jgi:hypothetical protein